jgi:WD40 repeat protein
VEAGEEALQAGEAKAMKLHESGLMRNINEDLLRWPCLLETVTAGDLAINRIVFHTQGRLAFCGYDGAVGLLVGFNDRALYARPHASSVRGIAVRGSDLYSIGEDGKVMEISFERNTMRDLGGADSPALTVAGHTDGRLVTGHHDGSVRVWNNDAGFVTVLSVHDGPVSTVAVGRRGEICSGGADGRVSVLSRDMSSLRSFVIPGASVNVVAPYVDGRLAVATHRVDTGGEQGNRPAAHMLLLDPETGRCLQLTADGAWSVSAMSVYFDGRLVAVLQPGDQPGSPGELAVVDPGRHDPAYSILGGHEAETRSCLSMGPRIISCGSETQDLHTVRIWGTAAYVAAEYDKARLLPPDMPKPPYYRSLF